MKGNSKRNITSDVVSSSAEESDGENDAGEVELTNRWESAHACVACMYVCERAANWSRLN